MPCEHCRDGVEPGVIQYYGEGWHAPTCPWVQAVAEVTDRLGEYTTWARVEGLLTREERADKARAFARLEAARRTLHGLENWRKECGV
jgi:hypothetical protein